MLKKDEKQIGELKEAEASKKIAQEFIERYQKGLEETKVERKTDKQEKDGPKSGERKASISSFI